MKALSERDKDYLAGILDHCDRIEAAISRFGNTMEAFLSDADYRDVIMVKYPYLG